MALHVDPVAAVYLPRAGGEDRVTVVAVVVVAVARVERSFEYTIRMCGIRMRDRGADHLCDPLRVTLLFPARAPAGSTLRGAGEDRASPPSAEPLARGGRWPRARGLLVRRRGRVGGACRPTYTLADGERGRTNACARGVARVERKEGKVGSEEEEEEEVRAEEEARKVGGVLDGSRLLGGRARTYRTSCTYRPALSTT